MGIAIRRLTEADLTAVDHLRQLAGWNQTVQDWARLLSLEPEGCFLASTSDQVVGTVTTTTYGSAIAWIGMMLVHPDHRKQGIGTTLMRTALDYLSSRRVLTVRLDATPAGFPLYQRLGFVPEWTLTRWQRPALTVAAAPQPDPPTIRELLESDWPAVIELDQQIFGAPRDRLLRGLARGDTGATARVWPAAGPLRGWGLLRPGSNAKYLGPLVCLQPEASRLLLEALLTAAATSAVTWDITDQNQPAQLAAQDLGFVPVRPLTRMRLAPNPPSRASPALYAIADPALG